MTISSKKKEYIVLVLYELEVKVNC